ncbi:uncharacterized protein LAESUDRAFT_764281 [Laetiporus sulphureus 93-53]|uniref:Protein NO VEIN C-terminal domain-containing protein n=1 Tax=Laetiporus sulphureus 93-53 TaxID=1314785 RepID=A0A165BDT1_9APHY|nr:uncharacterized protein LAESUDRAFT_764281 [Laetiporus sulphureus 93-53]KZT00826.1 hypothetical protein LAESUDRAFT_764281 [Laetiporus sulphureus 93-53]
MDLINSINRSHGLGSIRETLEAEDPIVVLRGKLERACERLSKDLYNTKTHFLLEFIQNADDNAYGPGSVPTLQLQLEGRQMTIKCNEQGFTPANVKAICDIGGSTKTKDKLIQGYIGEKGIGFKAVFVVASKVHVASNAYTFRFDRDAPLGMINPIWDATHNVDQGWTTFRLDIAEHEHMGKLSKQIGEIQPSLLLFLRKLRSIGMRVTTANYPHMRTISVARNDPAPDIVELERWENGTSVLKCRYIVIKHMVSTILDEPKREGIGRSEVVLAFPMTSDEQPILADQYVHAFLPVSQYGFAFVTQGDFLTPSSRESILADSRWNERLFLGISDAFFIAIDRFQDHPVLKDVWIRFVPLRPKQPFAKVAERIASMLAKRAVLRSTDGALCHPIHLIVVLRELCDLDGEPLIPAQYLSGKLRYLSKSYNVSQDMIYLQRLGVRTMNDQDFFDGLKRMGNQISRQSDSWHELVCGKLHDKITKGKQGRKAKPAILDLVILPLNDGSWASAKSAPSHVFVSDLKEFKELQLSSIREGIPETSSRYRFYAALGVKPAGPALIAERILTSQTSTAPETLLRYSRFFFEHRRVRGMPSASTLKVVDERGLLADGKESYLDLSNDKETETTSLRSILPSTARFLHPTYTDTYQDRYWTMWLQDSLGVNTAPRVVSGRLSLEFQMMTQTLETSRLLLVLREYWPQMSRKLSQEGKTQLSRMIVTCEDGRYPLETTALRRRALQSLPNGHIRFLPMLNANDHGWNFLGELGVMIDADLGTFIKILIHLQQTKCQEESSIMETYKQLNARFHDNPGAICSAFKDYPLLYVPRAREGGSHTWLALRDAYWDGPRSLRSKVLVKRLYPTLEDFFRDKLGMQNASLQTLVDEFKNLANQWNGKPLPESTILNIEGKLLEITDYLVRDMKAASTLSPLAQQPIFPVFLPGKRDSPRLQAMGLFYVPDRSGKYADHFLDRVPLLAVSAMLSIVRIQPLLDSVIWKQSALYLENSVRSQTKASGTRTEDTQAMQQFKSRLEYIERDLYHKRGSSEQMEFLQKLDTMTVTVVDSILSTLTLGGHTVTSNANSSIEEQVGRVAILVARACTNSSRRRNREICSLLGTRLGLDRMSLQTLIDTPLDEVEEMLDEQGITAIPAEARRLHCHARYEDGTLVDASPRILSTESSGAAAIRLSSAGTQGHRRAKSNVEAEKTNVDVRTFRAKAAKSLLSSSQVLSAGSSRFQARTAGNLAAPISAGKHGKSSGKASENKDMAVAPSAANDRENGIMGEYFIYEVLQQTLGADFNEENWTSELRGEISGFTPFQGDALADFRYKDDKGILTGLWYGNQTKSTWAGRWPTYHLEIKTTSGSAREPFHVSQRQMEMALHLTSRTDSPGIVPTDVYVIILVTGIRGASTSYVVFLDPHRRIYDGNLSIQSDVYLSLL